MRKSWKLGLIGTLVVWGTAMVAVAGASGTMQTPSAIIGQVMALTQWGNSMYLELDLNADSIGDIWVKVTPQSVISSLEGDILSYEEITVGTYVQIDKYFWDKRLQLCQALDMKLCNGTCEQFQEMCKNVGDVQQLKERIKQCTQICQCSSETAQKHENGESTSGPGNTGEKKGSGQKGENNSPGDKGSQGNGGGCKKGGKQA